MAHQLQPSRVEDRPKKGRQLGLVTAGSNQHARARTLGIPELPRRAIIPPQYPEQIGWMMSIVADMLSGHSCSMLVTGH
jgi:hypothetical protein